MNRLLFKPEGHQDGDPLESMDVDSVTKDNLYRIIINAARLKREIEGRQEQLDHMKETVDGLLTDLGIKYAAIEGVGSTFFTTRKSSKFSLPDMKEFLVKRGVDINLLDEATAAATTEGDEKKSLTMKFQKTDQGSPS